MLVFLFTALFYDVGSFCRKLLLWWVDFYKHHQQTLWIFINITNKLGWIFKNINSKLCFQTEAGHKHSSCMYENIVMSLQRIITIWSFANCKTRSTFSVPVVLFAFFAFLFLCRCPNWVPRGYLLGQTRLKQIVNRVLSNQKICQVRNLDIGHIPEQDHKYSYLLKLVELVPTQT